jgi:hypothetical protein
MSVVCFAAYGDQTVQSGFQTTVVVESSKWENAPNSPIWLDVKITNTSDSAFSGSSYTGDDVGIVGETHSPSKDDIAKCLTPRYGGGGFCDLISLKSGEAYTKRVLLNDLVRPLRPGLTSVWILFPLSPVSGPSVCLTTKLTLQIGPVLGDQKLEDVYRAVLSSLSKGSAGAREDALREAAVLPYDYAMRALTVAVEKYDAGTAALPIIAQLPHTQKGKELIQEIAKFTSASDAEIVRQYLSDY